MTKKYKLALFIFRRDLRLEDNTGLMNALTASESVIPAFIFDPRQIGSQNEYRSDNAVQFMLQSLTELDEDLRKHGSKLYIFQGEASKIVSKIIKAQNIDAIFTNRDYTPFSKTRDEKISEICQKNEIDYFNCHDLLLSPIAKIKTQQETPYKVFSAFKRAAQAFPIKKPNRNNYSNYFTGKIEFALAKSTLQSIAPATNKQIFRNGGRSEALKILGDLSAYNNYEEDRNYPAIDATTGLSPHHKFGTISIREVYHKIYAKYGPEHDLINELYWRDFYTYIAHHFPLVFGKEFIVKYSKFPWSYAKTKYQKWCDGQTGFPIVDAGMRQLNQTGWMHNRVRMIVASFLCKDLQIDWRWGEKYFAQKLVDYDPAINNGSWQWSASTGTDAQPYFRIFNPWSQQKRYDKECQYIKKWLPELTDIPAKDIHKWPETHSEYFDCDYPAPILDHKPAAADTKAKFKALT